MSVERFVQVDAFTDRPFAGNAAAVCVLSEPADERWMQDLARETGLPATTFVRPGKDGFELRWFSPTIELALCGHGTLASAHVVWEEELLPETDPVRFHTRAGLLTATRESTWIQLDFPAEPEESAEPPPDLIGALGIAPRYVGRNRLDYLVELESEDIVRALEPDFSQLRRVPTRCVIVTSRATTPNFDFVSRCFAPSVGVDEDPATGSAHCCLGPFWQRHLGKADLVGYQASARGGVVRVSVRGDRVLLGGQAVTIWRGTLTGGAWTQERADAVTGRASAPTDT